MTEKKNKTRKGYPARALTLCLAILMLVFMLAYADAAARHARRGLALIATTLIPSLFPFMVISDVLCRCGFISAVGRFVARPMRGLFGISGEGAGVMLLGMLCGFPIGAKCAVSLYDSGEISKTECARLISLSSLPSAAFSISTVGVSLFCDFRVGVCFYLATVLSAIIVGVIDARLHKSGKDDTLRKKEKPRADFGVGELTEAVSSSAVGVIKISGFVLFFSVLLGVISELSFVDKLGEEAIALFFSVFELTSGVARAAAVSDIREALTLSAFALGWSSFSIHFQIMSVAAGRGLELAGYIASKLFQGVISAALVFLFSALLPMPTKNTGGMILTSGMPSTLSAIVLTIFSLSLALAIAKKARTW